MKYRKIYLLPLLLVVSISLNLTIMPEDERWTGKDFSTCAAILFEGKMLVNEYSPKGSCRLEQGMRGKLTVSAVILTDPAVTPTIPLTFRVAIQDEETGTIWLATPASVQSIEIEDLLKQCKKGDKLIVITEQKAYSLPHHTIEIFDGC